MNSMRVKSNSTQSIMVPYNLQVTLWDQGGLYGNREVVNGIMPADDTYLLVCQNLAKLPKKVRSFTVAGSNKIMPAVGYWHPATSSETQTFKYRVGFSYNKTKGTDYQQQYVLSSEMSFGFNFKLFGAGASSTTKINRGYT